MSKPARRARPLADLLDKCLGDTFARRGFAASEIVTHWEDLVGPEIAACSEPMRIDWPRRSDQDEAEPATLVLRVEGPAAIEVQHLAGVIIERVNQVFGWPAVGRLALRQAPLRRRASKKRRRDLDPEAVRAIAETLRIDDEGLRGALARLGAAVKNG